MYYKHRLAKTLGERVILNKFARMQSNRVWLSRMSIIKISREIEGREKSFPAAPLPPWTGKTTACAD